MPAMLMEAERVLNIPSSSSSSLGGIRQRHSYEILFDENLSRSWAEEIQNNMKESESVRDQEDMRPMAYRLVPEVWKRMRPPNLLANNNESTEDSNNNDVTTAVTNNNKDNNSDTKEDSMKEDGDIQQQHGDDDWTNYPIRNEMRRLDFDKSIVFSLLFSQSTSLHIACGAKFGSDFLLYDGPRHERHAFAGLRVWGSQDVLPPTPYNLHGFVRCLNTAGKLSLLAKVEHSNTDNNILRVAIVDLALEKILSAPRFARRSVKQARRDMGKNLAKKTGSN
mmetsp:Transcript_30400/g.34650  ORF Transcript_30400/g.34650 Transcript_30400/m.34650 type:complete len:279 (+) Transcript_30400:854-1690(+)